MANATQTQTEVYLFEQVIVLFSCALSFLGSSLIILTYIIWSDLRTTPRKLLVYLSVSDWLSAVSYAFGVWSVFRTNSAECVAQGAISTFANTSSFFWTVAIAVYLYVFIVRTNQRVADSLVLVFHLVRYAFTGVVFEIIVVKNEAVHAALSEYRPILANRPAAHSFSSMADVKLTLIPIIFIVLRIWSTVRFILLLADSNVRQNPALVTLHGIGNTLQGAANCVMFVLFTQPIRTRLCAALSSCSHCRAEARRPHRLLPEQDATARREEDSTERGHADR
ncbi:G-protein coupled receptor 157 [Neolamprologus brichardi]|uniref:G-protein coupled receptor 157 n=1 Tax=Neolamprologus brichardi TaxID=32507 RepID=UPI0003EBC1CD|nr:G-protein coupled receptor 157 [Neolamprologus brichardi]